VGIDEIVAVACNTSRSNAPRLLAASLPNELIVVWNACGRCRLDADPRHRADRTHGPPAPTHDDTGTGGDVFESV